MTVAIYEQKQNKNGECSVKTKNKQKTNNSYLG